MYTVTMYDGGDGANAGRKTMHLNYGAKLGHVEHEFGHLMGLADTYDYTNGQIMEGQPPSRMNSRYWSNDDTRAVWTLWHFLNNFDILCGPGYRRSDENNSGGSIDYRDVLCEPLPPLPERKTPTKINRRKLSGNRGGAGGNLNKTRAF
jgi:hypothetical protein